MVVAPQNIEVRVDKNQNIFVSMTITFNLFIFQLEKKIGRASWRLPAKCFTNFFFFFFGLDTELHFSLERTQFRKLQHIKMITQKKIIGTTKCILTSIYII